MKEKITILVCIFILGSFFFVSFPIFSASLEGYNLIIITLDTVRADYVGFYNPERKNLTPHVDRIAEEGIGFQNCYTSVPQTLPSHCSLFTGKYPIAHGVRNNASYVLPDDELTMAEIFKRNGYETYAVISSYVLASKFGLGQGFDMYDDALDSSRVVNSFGSEITADRVYQKFRLWLETHFNKKFFSWVHFYDPHQPYRPPDPYDKKYGGDLYAGEVAYVDHHVGKIVADLKKKGIYDKTLLIIFGDHGEDLGEHQEYGHGTFCYNQSIRVPLFFSKNQEYPKDELMHQAMNLVDVMPLVLELYGFKTDQSIQGLSWKQIHHLGQSKEKRLIYFESMYPLEEMGWAPITGIIENNFKYIHLPKPELYDLENDRKEKDNLYYEKYKISQDLDKKLKKFIETYSEENKAFNKKLSPEDIRHLTSLGYVSSFQKSRTMIDPKRGIAFRSSLRNVKQLINEDQLDRAEDELNKSMSAEPEIKTPTIYDLFEEIYKKKKDRKKLVEKQKEAIKEFPHNNQLRINLANTYFNFSNLAEAKKLCRDIIGIDPTYSRAFILLGKIDLSQQRFPQAKNNFNEAMKLEPKNYALKKMVAEVLVRCGESQAAVAILKGIGNNTELLSNRFDHPLLIKTASRLTGFGELSTAENILREIVRQNPGNVEALNELAGVYIKQGGLDRASGLYERALAINPDSALTMCNRGILQLILYQKSRDRILLDEALENFDQAIDKDPYYAAAVNGRASVKMFLNRIDEAIQDWKATIKIKPDFINAYFNLGIALIQKKNGSEALEYLNVLQKKYFDRLPKPQQNQLQRLIDEAKGGK